MEVSEIIDFLLVGVPALVTVASVIAAVTPTPKDDEIVGKAYKILDALAINVGKAKQKPGDSAT